MSATAIPIASAAPARAYLARTLAAGATVAVLDGLAAWLLQVVMVQRTSVLRLFQGIARAVLHEGAFEGGLATAALGLAMHVGVACGWATAYALLHQRWPALRAFTRSVPRALLVGVLFGAFVWLAMSLVVLPLTRVRSAPPGSSRFLILLAIHMVAVGPPIALVVRDR